MAFTETGLIVPIESLFSRFWRRLFSDGSVNILFSWVKISYLFSEKSALTIEQMVNFCWMWIFFYDCLTFSKNFFIIFKRTNYPQWSYRVYPFPVKIVIVCWIGEKVTKAVCLVVVVVECLLLLCFSNIKTRFIAAFLEFFQFYRDV